MEASRKQPEDFPSIRTAPAPSPSPAPAPASASNHARSFSCTECFDALWFCYSPFYQMQQYYRCGEFDTCFGKWNALFDCLSLKTKRPSEVQEILEAREKLKRHIWSYRTVEEASENWWKMYGHLFDVPPQAGQ